MQVQQTFSKSNNEIKCLYPLNVLYDNIYYFEDGRRYCVDANEVYFSQSDNAYYRVDVVSLEWVKTDVSTSNRETLYQGMLEELSGKTFQEICRHVVDKYVMNGVTH